MGLTRRSVRLAVLAVAGVAALTAATASSAAPPGSGRADQRAFAVTGFQEEGTAPSRITTDARALTTVGVDGVNLSPNGYAVGTPDPGALADLDTAHRDHLRATFLVGNFDNTINDFSEPYAHNLLASPGNIRTAVREIVSSVKRQGWDGVSVDLESLRARDRSGLVLFLTELDRNLPAGKTLSVCVTNFTTATAYRSNGYDLTAIGRVVNQVVLMAYDEHGSWENTPGPVGALGWQRKGLAVVLRSIPASKIDLGVAGYGYAWRPHSNYQVSDAAARRLVARDHGIKRFDAKVGEWTAQLPDGSTLWWSDARSYPLRVALAKRLGLHGLAVWDLGLSDRLH
jgi:spore germination protein